MSENKIIKMRIINIKSQEQLNGFMAGQKNSPFLQSWQWGKFREKAGGKIIRLGAQAGGKLAGVATLEKINLGFGQSYFYCPRGPIIGNSENKKQAIKIIFSEIGKIAGSEQAVFLRFEPDNEILAADVGFHIRKTIDIQPAKTMILDLAKTDEELLAAMHQKTRYNIRVAERKGIRVRIANSSNFTPDFENFWRIMEETVKRDKFRLHPKEHYRRLLAINNDFAKLVLAEYRGNIIAGNILVFFSGMATYVHGASGAEYRNVMAPYALQWQAIKLARKKGLKYYDLYGIDKDKWPGVTRFKEGFGGAEVNLPGTYDLVFNKNIYKLYGFLRSLKRLVS